MIPKRLKSSKKPYGNTKPNKTTVFVCPECDKIYPTLDEMFECENSHTKEGKNE